MNYYGFWTGHTVQSAPYTIVRHSVEVLLNLGVPPRKIILNIPAYGYSLYLKNKEDHGLYSPILYETGETAKYTRDTDGKWSFMEICSGLKEWMVVRHADGSYAYQGNQWVSFDDVEDVRRKSELIRSKKLGGGALISLDRDDFHGNCKCGKYPLLTTMNQVLRNIGGTKIENCV